MAILISKVRIQRSLPESLPLTSFNGTPDFLHAPNLVGVGADGTVVGSHTVGVAVVGIVAAIEAVVGGMTGTGGMQGTIIKTDRSADPRRPRRCSSLASVKNSLR
jgi:hypothetical protein